MIIKKFLAIMLAFLMISGSAWANTDKGKEIRKLRKEVVRLTKVYRQEANKSQLIKQNTLARYQAEFLIKVFSYEIHSYTKKMGVNRKFSDIEDMVRAAYQCSWIFTDLGENHIDRLELILQWAKDESMYDKDLITSWKKGTYLKSIDKKVLKDTKDYGPWQINIGHENNLKILNFLYQSGVITLKIKKIKTINDVMDVNTNCVSRCIIETDRKSRGWEWQHIRDYNFFNFLKSITKKLEKDGLYSRDFAERYYNVIPVKEYKDKRFFEY